MWTVYLVRCADDSLYCGITNNLEARIAAHSAGKGAKYTRRRGPVTLVFARKCRGKPLALRLEYAIKQLTREEKVALVAKPRMITPLVVRARKAMREAA